ncbi:MAG: hypothetical protein U1D67_05390 [Dehalococcoidia bacterium]|nr:hypothetical protein [Dehalococcoidia bacterium]
MNNIEAAIGLLRSAKVLIAAIPNGIETDCDFEGQLAGLHEAINNYESALAIAADRILPEGVTVERVLEAMEHFATEGFATTIEYLTGRIAANSTLTQLRQSGMSHGTGNP